MSKMSKLIQKRLGKKCKIMLAILFFLAQFYSFGNLSFLGETTVLAASQTAIQSTSLSVTVDDTFPKIIQYQWLGAGASQNAVFYGNEDTMNQVKINGTTYTPTVTSVKTGDTITYILNISSIGVTMTMYFKVIDNIVEFKVSDIAESGATKVMTFEIPNQNLISIRDDQAGAQETGVDVKGSVNYTDNSKEEYNALSTKAVDANPVAKSYLILNTDKLAATLYNNAINTTPTTGSKILGDKFETRYYYQTMSKTSYKRMGAWNNAWTYREVPTEIMELPYAKIAITPDVNNDSTVDWQDGATAYRQIMKIPYGADTIKKSFAGIAYTRGSLAQWPFLRTLDMVKKINLYTDGFGQFLEYKGHQAEGHDSNHPDYGVNINKRAGGLTDLNYFVNEAAKYNTSVGVHINATEAYPEAQYYSEDLLRQPHAAGWNSLDQAYLIDQYKDATNLGSHGLADRLAELKSNVPGLKWVYVDVYYFQGYPEWKLGTELNKNGWAVGTEFQGALEDYAVWNHVPQMKSQVVRFMKNGVADSFGFNPMLLKSRHAGSMGYGDDGNDDQGNNTGLVSQMKIFYTNNLLMKYMQNFDIMKWTDNRIDFTNNVYVKETTPEPNPVVELYKDNKKIAAYQNNYDTSTYNISNVSAKVFIPWDPQNETKIYHFNTAGGSTTWDLPGSWSGMRTVKLYQLSDTGKTFVKDLNVTNGQVTIDATANTPYVIYKGEQTNPVMTWGAGGFVKDPGFDSHDLSPATSAWTTSSTGGSTNHIHITNNSLGETYLNVNGNNGADATLSQTITGLTPGKSYQLSAWMEVNGRTGTIGVNNYGGFEVTNTMEKSELTNQYYNTLRYGRNNMQRIKLEFTVPANHTSADIYFKANAGTTTSYMYLDDVRIVEMNTTPFGSHYFFEDFESNDEGIGPFVQTKLVGRIHRSELHSGFTTDTINGNYSLKMRQTTSTETGEYMRTVPYNVKLQPNTLYKMSFNYLLDPINGGAYSVAVKGNNGAITLTNVPIPSSVNGSAYSTFTKTFLTGNYEDAYVSFIKNGGGMIDFVMDDFALDVVPVAPPLAVPTGLKATALSPSQISVSWDETDLATGYDLEVDGQVVTPAIAPYMHSGLALNSTHTYRVRAKNAAETTDWSAPVSAASLNAMSIVAAADAYVRDGGSASTNFGTDSTTMVKWDAPGYSREAFYKFNLDRIPANMTSAKIKLYPTTAGSVSPGINVEQVQNNWSESALTWNNKPSVIGAKLNASPIMPVLNTAFVIDVTNMAKSALASQDKNISIKLTNALLRGGSSDSQFATKENSMSQYWPVVEYTAPGSIRGKVVDSNNMPVSGATVTAFVTGSVYGSVDTTVDGTYTISDIPSGSGYTVTASKAGYMDASRSNVIVPMGDVAIVDMTLTSPISLPSNNADLRGLSLSGGQLNPAFAAGTTSYTANVTNNVNNISVTASVDDTHATLTVGGQEVASGEASGPIILNEGSNTINIVVTAQDLTTKTYTLTVIRESAPPATPILDNIVSGNGKLTLNWMQSSGATGYKVKYGTASGVYTSSVDAGHVSSITIEGLQNGVTYYFAISAYNAGEESSNSDEKIGTPDGMPPSTAAVLDGVKGSGDWYTSDVTVKLESQDDNSGPASTEYSLNVIQGPSVLQSTYGFVPYTAPLLLSEGIYQLQYRSTDSAGNVEAPKSITVNIDRTSPTTVLTANGNPLENGATFQDNQLLTLIIQSEDPLSGVASQSMTIDGVVTSTTQNIVNWEGQLGNHVIQTVVTDRAGNSKITTISVNVTTNVSALQQLIAKFVASGEINGSLTTQITNKFTQSLDQLSKGHNDQAIKHMQDVLKQIDKAKQGEISAYAKQVLTTDAYAIMAVWSK
ncbi:DNRLRE domain-containing protein [Paenibacillus sp. LMG 31460]|uniref:DNRLRE domain-containing protein n=1 Tax=Paenibacillus germinis TaxID=2654979 RepID=A0ABX1Z601_9BACL|nr:endo-alpha-N-acetylgalactosaminidase family protein [Paenibacillus germinis]NOU88702.1 DNRLRE domain-containing protein [Paenibacillus germinis]